MNNLARSLDDRYIIDSSKSTKEHLKKVENVLKYYGVKYKFSDGRLMIDSRVWGNKETMTNITAKAFDKKWLNEHSPTINK